MASLWVAWTHHWQCQGGESGGLSLTHCCRKRYWIPLTKHWLGGLLGRRPHESCEFGPAWKDTEPWRLISKGSPWKKNNNKKCGRRYGSMASWFMQWTLSAWPWPVQMCMRWSQLCLAAGLWASRLQSALLFLPTLWRGKVSVPPPDDTVWTNPLFLTAKLCASEGFAKWWVWPERCLSHWPGMKVININCLSV